MICPGCKKEIDPEVKSCPNCNRLIVSSARDRLFPNRGDHEGVPYQHGKTLVGQNLKENVILETEAEYEPVYSDVLRTRDTISVRGIGTKMEGPHHVESVRHEIAASYESAERIQCRNCRRINEKNDKFCRNCGIRLH